MISLKINQTNYFLKENISILEACRFVGDIIPRFCYHETLSVAGNCRMCLVRLETDDKLIVSCVNDISDNMEIFTDDAFIKKAREDVMEFLLLNHPLDCPICDQGGECDLQDQAKIYGNNHNRLFFNKVTVDDKNFNSFIKSIMTRCIHCTRCVRFSTEITGKDFFGTLSRGHSTEIGSYSEDYFDSEISGNVIDLCPVGALTSKSYAFKVRPWELKTVESIDTTDSLGSNTYINFSESSVLRVLPKYNSEINENLISDKARFSYDSLVNLTLPGSLGRSQKVNLKSNLSELIKKLSITAKKSKVLILVNEDTTFELLQYLNSISTKNSNIAIKLFSKDTFNNPNFFNNYNSRIQDFYSANLNCFLFATNPRTEAALLNKRLRFLNYNNFFNVYHFGYKYVSNYKIFFSNLNVDSILSVLEGKSLFFSNLFSKFESPLVLFGLSLAQRGLSFSTLETTLRASNPSAICFNIVLKSNSVGTSLLNFQPVTGSDFLKSSSYIIVDAEENISLRKILNFSNKEIFWVNNSLLQISTKKLQNLSSFFFAPFFQGIFINLECRPQKSYGINSLGESETSYFKIFNTIFNFNSDSNKNFTLLNLFLNEIVANPLKFSKSSKKSYLESVLNSKNFIVNNNLLSCYPIKSSIIDFYRTNNTTRLSKNMQVASKELDNRSHNFI